MSHSEVPLDRMLKLIDGLPDFSGDAVIAFVGSESSYDFLVRGKPLFCAPNLDCVGVSILKDLPDQFRLLRDSLDVELVMCHAEHIYETISKHGISRQSALTVKRAVVRRPWTTSYAEQHTMLANLIASRCVGDDVGFFAEVRNYDEDSVRRAGTSLTTWFHELVRGACC